MAEVARNKERLALPDDLGALADSVRGFMPSAEGEALAYWATRALDGPSSVGIEIGSYCGKSTIYLAYAASLVGATIVSVDHHHGSEENGPGWTHHDSVLVDPISHEIDTLYRFRRTLAISGLDSHVAAVVAPSQVAAALLLERAKMVFIDGGHGHDIAWSDYLCYAPKVAPGGLLIIHDVFEDPSQGGRPPWEIYTDAIGSGAFFEVGREGSLRVLRSVMR